MKTKPKKITTVRLSEQSLTKFDACAARRGVSRNLLLQQVIDQFIRKDAGREKEGVL